MDLDAILVSIQLAAATSALLLLLGLPLGAWLAFTQSRLRGAVEALSALPLVLPPTVLGFYVLLAIGPEGPVGRLVAALGGPALPFSFAGLLLASALYSLPFAVQPFAAAFAGVDRRLIEAAWCLGHGRLSTFARVVLPLSWPGVLTGVVLSFAHTIGEFGVVLMVGGNIAGRTRTVSVSIYDSVQALELDKAAETSALLTLFSFVVLAVVYARKGAGGAWARP